MARTSIEQTAFTDGRVKTLARAMDWFEETAFGVMLLIWQGSQSREIEICSKDEILSWLSTSVVKEIEKNDSKFFEALLRAKLLTASDDMYLVRGNKKHIENIKILKEKSARGGKNSGKARRGKPPETKNKSGEACASNNAKRALEHNTLQCMTMHDSAMQDNASLKPFAPPDAGGSEKKSRPPSAKNLANLFVAKILTAFNEGAESIAEAKQIIGPDWPVVEMLGGWRHLWRNTQPDRLAIHQAQWRDMAKAFYDGVKLEVRKLEVVR